MLGERIIAELLGTKRIRYGPLPTKEVLDSLVEIADWHVARDRPVRTVTLWGALKCYGLWPERQTADCLDRLGFLRLAGLNYAVQTAYLPGLECVVLLEDVTEYLLSESLAELADKIDAYHQSLLLLNEDLRLGLRIELESTAIVRAGFRLSDYLHMARAFAERLHHAYETGDYRQLPGWSGPLSQAVWAYYLKRAASEKPEAAEAERLQYVCLYFGNSLARKTVRALAGLGEGPAIKASLAPYPAGTAPELYKGRIEYKLKDSKKSNASVPPWAALGVEKEGKIFCYPAGACRRNCQEVIGGRL